MASRFSSTPCCKSLHSYQGQLNEQNLLPNVENWHRLCIENICLLLSILKSIFKCHCCLKLLVAGTAVQEKWLFQLGTEPRKGLSPDFETTKHSNEVDLIYMLTISHKCTTWHFSNNCFNIIHFDTSRCYEKQNELLFCDRVHGVGGAGFHLIFKSDSPSTLFWYVRFSWLKFHDLPSPSPWTWALSSSCPPAVQDSCTVINTRYLTDPFWEWSMSFFPSTSAVVSLA